MRATVVSFRVTTKKPAAVEGIVPTVPEIAVCDVGIASIKAPVIVMPGAYPIVVAVTGGPA